MDVVLRSVNQRFLEEVAFPLFADGGGESADALQRMMEQVDDPQIRTQAEALIERTTDGGLSEREQDRFQEIVYRLLFSEWQRTSEGWATSPLYEAYAGELEETLNLSLMLTDASYPYWDEAKAAQQLAQVLSPPWLDRGLPAFIAGIWDPFPSFAPGLVLTTRGTNLYVQSEQLAQADWSYRHATQVQQWSSELHRAMRELMQREVERLRPIEVPEANEVVDFWLGKSAQPPHLVVAFSGLGPRAAHWVRQLAALAAQVRRAASREQGMTAIITGGSRAWF